jgi:hypothetical protein
MLVAMRITMQTCIEPTFPPRFQAAFRTFGGAALLLGGIILYAAMAIAPQNWWALFVLYPAAFLIAAGLTAATQRSILHPAATLPSGMGALLFAVGWLLLTGSDWSVYWPLMVVIPGLWMAALGAYSFGRPAVDAFSRSLAWTGISTTLLGALFLIDRLGLLPLLHLLAPFRWWSVFVLLPGIGAIYNASRAARAVGGRIPFSLQTLAALGLATCANAAAITAGLGWGTQVALSLTAAGLVFLAASR